MNEMKPKKKGEIVGVGCLVQAIGLLMPFIGYELAGVIGAFLGCLIALGFLLVGSRMALKWVCPECRNPVASSAVKVCSVCHTRFD